MFAKENELYFKAIHFFKAILKWKRRHNYAVMPYLKDFCHWFPPKIVALKLLTVTRSLAKAFNFYCKVHVLLYYFLKKYIKRKRI